MNITSIRIKKVKDSGTLLGIATVHLDDCLVIHDLQLVQLKDKRIVSFPNKKVKKIISRDGNVTESYEYSDIVHPSNKEFRNYIETEVFKLYDILSNSNGGSEIE